MGLTVFLGKGRLSLCRRCRSPPESEYDACTSSAWRNCMNFGPSGQLQKPFVLSALPSSFPAPAKLPARICPPVPLAELLGARGRKDRHNNNSAPNEELSRLSGMTKQNAKSNKCPGQPGTTQARRQIRQRLSRSPFEAFPLRQRRDHERQVLGLSRSQDA